MKKIITDLDLPLSCRTQANMWKTKYFEMLQEVVKANKGLRRLKKRKDSKMGMLDYINYKAPCPKCGTTLDNFQSKDGPCCLSTLEPWQVTNFYTMCECGEWVEFEVEAEVEHIVKKMTIKLK